ncbi:tetratricopeptide repeat protein [Granulicella sp. WH15]|uniref:tetratricopeptide repeat protein n=1 Tax=Granulicella sp. WH15 TaxID=2602070 RepID=UPI002108487E|nr:tetratricopeptide repeat protein [Granulicella sp. WH15]
MTRYTRQDVLRILQLPARHLAAWEREGLIRPEGASDSEARYTFEHLSQIRALREMYSARISARSIRASIDAMQRVSGMRNPLTESTAVRRGSRINFRIGGALVDPVTRQLAFDFDLAGSGRQMTVVRRGGVAAAQDATRSNAQVQEMFLRAVQLEENPTTIPDAALLYEAILELRPEHAPACINLGTIRYNQRNFSGAETMYRRATESDPSYALAFFDLGNVLDEMQDLAGAIIAYRRAIEIVPGYADAHYNLALAYERVGERRRALRHWMAYVRLDPMGPWSLHARTQARKILSLDQLSIVSRGGRTVGA